MISKIKSIIKEGFLHIISTSVINKLLAMLTSIVVVRLFTKDEYGNFSYAYNIVTTVISFSSLGTTNAMLQYGCEIKDDFNRRSVEKSLFFIGLVSNVVASLLTFFYALFIPLSIPEAKYLLLILSFLPVFQFVYNVCLNEMRVLGRNKAYAWLTNIQTIAYFIAACLGGYLFRLTGTTIGRYVGYIVPSLVGSILLYKEILKYKDVKAEKKCKEQLKYSFWVLLNNVSSAIFYHLDVLVIGLVVAEASVLADYKVATQIPTALTIIPISVATFIYPKFVTQKANYKWIKNNYLLIVLMLAGINSIVCLASYFFAPQIISIVYGTDYSGAIHPFRLLLIAYFITGTFRTITGYILSMLHEVKANFWIGVISCLFNIIGDYLLIKEFGSNGAAYATIFVVVIESFILVSFFLLLLKKKKTAEQMKGE